MRRGHEARGQGSVASSLLVTSEMVSPTRIISLALTVTLVASAGQAQSPQLSAPPQGPAVFTPDQLDQLLAPIALHPDPLVGQILMAATYPLEVVQATRWLQDPNHAALTGSALVAALDLRPWDPSVKALVSFPEILRMMDGVARVDGSSRRRIPVRSSGRHGRDPAAAPAGAVGRDPGHHPAADGADDGPGDRHHPGRSSGRLRTDVRPGCGVRDVGVRAESVLRLSRRRPVGVWAASASASASSSCRTFGAGITGTGIIIVSTSTTTGLPTSAVTGPPRGALATRPGPSSRGPLSRSGNARALRGAPSRRRAWLRHGPPGGRALAQERHRTAARCRSSGKPRPAPREPRPRRRRQCPRGETDHSSDSAAAESRHTPRDSCRRRGAPPARPCLRVLRAGRRRSHADRARPVEPPVHRPLVPQAPAKPPSSGTRSGGVPSGSPKSGGSQPRR